MIYHAYPRSWSDSDGDGVGDLRGVIHRLDHLEWLGVNGLWLNPIMPSPNRDWGYDVSDYCAVHPALGTLGDLDELVAAAGQRGISIVLDLVPSHTSDQHPWFLDASSSRGSRYRDYYVWRRPGPGGSVPNNWKGYFGLPAWTLDERTGEYYMHNFSSHQPQLNWWNGSVRAEFDRIMSFWLDRGINGIRIDAVQTLLYDRQFRDNPRAAATDSVKEREVGQRFTYNANQPEAHAIVKRWRTVLRGYEPARLLFGETWVPSLEEMAEYYGDGTDEFDLAWNLPFLQSRFAAQPLRQVVARTLELLPGAAWPAWAMSTHDAEGRAATRWCGGGSDAIRCALLILLTLRGTPILYYGDEIGMTEPSPRVLRRAVRDRMDGRSASRDSSRTPMQWEGTPGAGFTTSPDPWLPIGNAEKTNVEAQRTDPQSILWLTRDLLALRRSSPDLALGTQEFVASPPGTLVWRRGEAMLVAVNLGTATRRVSADGVMVISTDRAQDHQRVPGWLELHPLQGAVVRSIR